MLRCKFALAVLMMLGLAVSVGVSQGPPKGKGKKEPEKTLDQLLEPDTFKDDLRIVREGLLKGEGPELVEYFRSRTLKQPDPKQIAALVKQLGDEQFVLREKAFKDLQLMETSALAGLKEGESDPSLEVRKRVADLKQRIDTKAEPTKQAAAARIIAKLKPDGAVDVLMGFLPFSSDAMVIDEICKALGAMAVNNGKVEPVLVTSLNDPIAVKRAAAGEALVRANVVNEIPNVKKLLADKNVSVRLRVCMAMIPLKDRAIVPVMIDLMGELPASDLWPVEESLQKIAGDKAPTVSLGNDDLSKKTRRDAWSKWYAENEKTIDMAKMTQGDVYLGYTLIVQQNNRIGPGVRPGATGEIFELDKERNVRWKITSNFYPVDAQVIPGNRVLVAEYQGNRVTEYDQKGEAKWSYNCGGNPVGVQRLANGNTFIVMQGRLVEVDRNKAEVWSYQRQQPDIMRARKLANGEVVVVHHNNFVGNQNSTCLRLSRDKAVLKSFNVPAIQITFGNIDVLPNGNILIPHYQIQRVHEYDPNGGQVKTFNLNWPNAAQRLPNGHTLITSYNSRQVVEFDANGGQVQTYTADGLVFNARRR